MPIYSPEALDTFDFDEEYDCSFHHKTKCLNSVHLSSSFGIGPRGHSITVKAIAKYPGCYQLQFIDETTEEVLETTPNLDPGSRLYICKIQIPFVENDIYIVPKDKFVTGQTEGSKYIQIGDVVLFNVRKDNGDEMSGIGIVIDVSNSNATFKVYEYMNDDIVTTDEIADHSITGDKMSVTMSITNSQIDEILAS